MPSMGIVCAVSDGVTEAMNQSGELYGSGRLARLLRSLASSSPAAIAAAIRGDVARFAQDAEVADDLTLLILRWNGPSER
jgi:sigma-B regulation protein RsbU (phosphoserine phosphatase)